VRALHAPTRRAACSRACHRAHSRAYPYLELFEYLLQQGADADLLTYEGWNVRARRQ